MKAEIISIGTELVNGQNLDTNCHWLSQQLSELGVTVCWHTTIADDLDANIDAFRIAANRAGLVLITGGLGPTLDDLTREALAKAAGVELELHEPSLSFIKQLFASRKRRFPERNRVQALFPRGAEAIPNKVGTAPGIWLQLDSAFVAAMPGVPTEMKAMFARWVKPRLHQLGLSSGVLLQRKLNVFGAGESDIEEKLGDLTQRGHVPEVGITASDATISLRIIAHAASLEDAQRRIEPVEQTIQQRLGKLVFGFDEEQLQDVVMRMLLEEGKTVATAESVTAGLVAARLADVPGASAALMGGITAYDSRIKTKLLGVANQTIADYSAVSKETAEAMAIGCRQRFATDFAISTTGLAGPAGGTPEKPIGLVFVGLAWNGGVTSQRYVWPGNRQEVRSRTAKMALNQLRLHLLNEV